MIAKTTNTLEVFGLSLYSDRLHIMAENALHYIMHT